MATPLEATAIRSLEPVMSTTHHGNGTITLTNFAELGNVRDLLTLPDAPAADLTAAAIFVVLINGGWDAAR